MIHQSKQVVVILDGAVTNGETVTGVVDTLDYDFMTMDICLSTADSVSNNPSTLKLTELDTNVISSAATFGSFEGDTGFTIPACVTAGDYGVKFNVDLRGRKRYIFLTVTPLTTQVVAAVANLTKGTEAPVNTTRANVVALVEG